MNCKCMFAELAARCQYTAPKCLIHPFMPHLPLHTPSTPSCPVRLFMPHPSLHAPSTPSYPVHSIMPHHAPSTPSYPVHPFIPCPPLHALSTPTRFSITKEDKVRVSIRLTCFHSQRLRISGIISLRNLTACVIDNN